MPAHHHCLHPFVVTHVDEDGHIARCVECGCTRAGASESEALDKMDPSHPWVGLAGEDGLYMAAPALVVA